jgi:hypothetical protein
MRDQLLAIYHAAKSHGMPPDFRFSSFLAEVFYTFDYEVMGFGFTSSHLFYPSGTNLLMDNPEFEDSLAQQIFCSRPLPLRKPGTTSHPIQEKSGEICATSEMDQVDSTFTLGIATKRGDRIRRQIPDAAFDDKGEKAEGKHSPNVAGLIDILQLRATTKEEIQEMERASLSRTAGRIRSYTQTLYDQLPQLLNCHQEDDDTIEEPGMARLAKRHAREVANVMAGASYPASSQKSESATPKWRAAELQKLRKRESRQLQMQQLQEQEQKRREPQHAPEDIKNGSATSIYGGQSTSAGNSLPTTPGQDQTRGSFHPVGTILTGTEILPTAYTPQLAATPTWQHTPMTPANQQAALSMMMMLLMDMCNQSSAAMLYRPSTLRFLSMWGI